MLYRVFRVLAGLAVRWFYRDVEVIGAQLIPDVGPVILAVNHPNALLDALVVVDAVPRPVRLTAKATLFEVPVLRSLLHHLGIEPLRQASDEPARASDPSRNEAAFDAIIESLRSGNAILIFPEGRSHSEPSLGALKSGLARIALRARDTGVRNTRIIPIGLVFERKWAARSRVGVLVGEPISLDDWASDSDNPVASLMADVQKRLESVTLNFETSADAEWQLSTAHALSAVFDNPRELGSPDRP